MTGPTNQRLKYVATINRYSLPEDTDPNRELRYIDISAVAGGSLVSSPQVMRFGDAPSRARRLVRPGDTIVSTVRTYLRAVWPVNMPTDDLAVSTGFAVISPGPKVDPRYLGWLAQSDPFIEDIVARSVGVSYPAINPSDIGNILVAVPPLTTQSTIAGFLNRETARIDALIATKRQMIDLLWQRLNTSVETRLRALSTKHGAVPLKFLASEVTVGIVITPSEWYVDRGVPALRGLNVRLGEVSLDDMIHLSEEGHRINKKSKLNAGDLVTVRTGQAGTTAIVPQELDGANCIDLLITRPGPLIVPEFLELLLNSDWVTKHIEANSVGAIQSHFNVGTLKDVPVPRIPVDLQRTVATSLFEERQGIRRLAGLLASQMDLLAENRRALITAAVAGQLEIPGVAA